MAPVDHPSACEVTRGGIADLRSEIGAVWGPGWERLGRSVGNHDLPSVKLT